MEVVITLNPLDRPEASKPRTFSLTKENRQVDVSRASKNPDRGLQPGPGNAVFHCPIMSRSHARFTASPVEKRVYIQDLGSTHGTFLGSKKLRVGTETALASGDAVTFGVTIMNGPSVYPAKTFRIEYSWQPRSQAIAAPTTPPVSRVFTVPDSDNEEENGSTHTREPSVQIMESNIRTTTYSVPSDSDYGSDMDELEDDDFQISSSPLEQTQSSAITTPEHHVSRPVSDASNECEDQKNKSLKLNLEVPKLQDAIHPTAGEGSSQNNPIDLAEQNAPDADVTGLPLSHQDLIQEQTQTKVFVEVDMNETESEDDGPEELPIQSRYKRTRAGTTSAIDGSDVDHDGLEGLPIQSQFGRNELAGTTNAAAESDIDDDDDKESEGEDEDVMNDEVPPNVEEAGNFNGAKYPEPSPRCGRPSRETFFTQRLPSPSDAALARTPGKVESMPSRVTSLHSTSFSHPTATFAEPPVFTWNAPPPTTWNSPPPATGYPMWRDDPNPYQYNAHANSGYAIAPHTMYIDPATHHPGLYNSQDAHEDLMTTHDVASAESVPHEVPVMRSIDNPASRLHITNLVNSYPTEPSSSAKRKANEISLDNDEAEIDSAPLHFATMSQDSTLPDAQPRDAPTATDTSIPIEEMSTTNVHPNPAEVATEVSLNEEPARKKVKTSSASGNGIGKFLMGVAVGAVGLAATFLATIPANVQEEVRLGL